MITLKSSTMSVEVDEQRGATIVAVRDADGRNALSHETWASPQPSHHGLSYGNDDLDFHSSFRGGWQETFPNAGQSCVVDGVPLPFHGEAATAQWTVVSHTDARLVLKVASRLPLTLERTMELDAESPVLRINGTVENDGEVDIDFVWGHHPAFPATAGAHIDFPAGARVRPDSVRSGGVEPHAHPWPTVSTVDGARRDLSVLPDGQRHELYYLDGLDVGWAAVRQPHGIPSAAMAWDIETYPYSWLWIMRGESAFPFYGRGSMMAIEAQSSWPYDGLANARTRGMSHRLAPGESRSSWYTMALFDSTGAAVRHVARDGRVEFDA